MRISSPSGAKKATAPGCCPGVAVNTSTEITFGLEVHRAGCAIGRRVQGGACEVAVTIKAVTDRDMAAIDELIRRTREALVMEYREVVWEIFCQFTDQTPQFTGRAVAHWDIRSTVTPVTSKTTASARTSPTVRAPQEGWGVLQAGHSLRRGLDVHRDRQGAASPN